MAPNGSRTSNTVSTATPVMRWSVMRRRQLMGGMATAIALELASISGNAPRGLSPRNTPNQQSGQRVHDDGDQEQSQTNLDQSRQIDVARRFAEFVGQNAGHGVSGGKQRFGDLRA